MFLTRPASERLSNGGSIDLGLGAMLPITSFIKGFCAAAVVRRMTAETKHLEITLDTQVESVNLAEEMCLRVAEAIGFGEDDCYRIGMRSEEHTSELQSLAYLVCRLLLEKKKKNVVCRLCRAGPSRRPRTAR